MPDITPNLGIKKPLGNENVSRASFNDNWDIIDANAAPRSLAQLIKTTADDGNVKYSVNDSSDFLAGLIALGKGMHSFYCVGTAVNAPPSGKTIRGFAHITGISPTNGYLLAMDYTGIVYSNYVFNGVWTGWESHVTDRKPTWNNLTLQNGWVSYGGADPTPQYTKIGTKVRFKGTIKGGTTASGTAIFTLPSGYRPAQRVIVPVTTAGGTNDMIWLRIFIETTGSVVLNSSWGSSTWISLDGIEFVADGN